LDPYPFFYINIVTDMDGLTIVAERCPDGVELAPLPETQRQGWQPIPARRVFRYRTDRRESQLLTIDSLEDPIVIRFVNAASDEKRRLFFERFGLDSRNGRFLWGGEPFAPLASLEDELRHDYVAQNQLRFREMLQGLSNFDPAVRMAAVNALIERRGFSLRPTFQLAGATGTPRLLLRSDTLIGFMMMEVAMGIANNARTAECEQCGTLFLTGPLTGRRSHARFCSDRCRVAAMRARNAEIKMRG
jgi:hypothetical protein